MRAWDSEEGGGGRAQEEEAGKKEANWASPELSAGKQQQFGGWIGAISKRRFRFSTYL